MISAVTKAKILYNSSKLLAEKGIVFVNVVTKEEIENIEVLVSVRGEKSMGLYYKEKNKMIGTLFFANSDYSNIFVPPKISWSLRLCSSSNEKLGLTVKNIIERKGPMIRLKIVSVIY